jgi:heme/copper-type cytochrome/quinol oxidase subunit 4
MEKKYKVAAVLSFIPALINIAVLVYGLSNFTHPQLAGYLIGTILAIILSVIWLIQVKRAAGSHAFKLFKITIKGFFIKLIVFLIFITGIYYCVDFDRKFFAASFFLALFIGAIIELWFYSSMNKEAK